MVEVVEAGVVRPVEEPQAPSSGSNRVFAKLTWSLGLVATGAAAAVVVVVGGYG